MTRDNIEAIWNSVESFYRTGLQPGMTMVVRRQGEIVLKRSIGHARGNPPPNHPDQDVEQVLMTPDTPICLFSASKAITAMLVHKLNSMTRSESTFPNLRAMGKKISPLHKFCHIVQASPKYR